MTDPSLRKATADASNRLPQLERENDRLRDALLDAERELADAVRQRAELEDLRVVADALGGELAAALAQRDAVQADRDQLLARYETVVRSSSWTMTAPLRRTIAAIRSRGW